MTYIYDSAGQLADPVVAYDAYGDIESPSRRQRRTYAHEWVLR
jgi:hypothetical protein